MTARKPPKPGEARSENELEALDPETIAFLKDYLAITDEDLRAHVRRLVEEIRLNPKKKS